MKVEREQVYETYNHRLLWVAATKNLEEAESQRPDAKYFALSAMYLYFAAFEGYLNWLGDRIAPDIWKTERTFFSCPPHKGTVGKLRYLHQMLYDADLDFSQGSPQTVQELEALRNRIAHPKTEAGKRIVKHLSHHFPPPYASNLEKTVSPLKARQAKAHLESLAECLHQKARLKHGDCIVELKPFNGPSSFSISDF